MYMPLTTAIAVLINARERAKSDIKLAILHTLKLFGPRERERKDNATAHYSC